MNAADAKLLLVVLVLLGCLGFFLKLCFFTVGEQTVVVIERFGAFARVARSGLRIRIPLVEKKASRLDLKWRSLAMTVETKCEDNVFLTLPVNVQYRIKPDSVREANYSLREPEKVIEAKVADIIRVSAPLLTFEKMFTSKADLAEAVKIGLTATIAPFGFEVGDVMVVDVEPSAEVKKAINAVMVAQRSKVTAEAEAEALRTKMVGQAIAEAEAMKLRGVGIADQRAKILEGLQGSVAAFQAAVPGSSPEKVMDLVRDIQYFETLKELGAEKVIMVPLSRDGARDLSAQVRDGTITGHEISREPRVS